LIADDPMSVPFHFHL